MSTGHPARRHDDGDHVEQAVLAVTLDVYPAHLSIDELRREMTDRPDDFAQGDRIDTAVRALVGAGLLHRHGPFLFATRAAVRFDELSS